MKHRKLLFAGTPASIPVLMLAFALALTRCGDSLDDTPDGEETFSSRTSLIENAVLSLGIYGSAVTSSNEAVATVEITGDNITLTSKGAGTATINATSGSEGGVFSEPIMTVTVAADGSISNIAFLKGQKTLVIDNAAYALGIIGKEAKSSDPDVAGVEIKDGAIQITPAGEGLASITVVGPDDKSDAVIEVKVAATGDILLGPIAKGGAKAIKISGTAGGATLAGEERPITMVRLNFDWENVDVRPDEQGRWYVKHAPFDKDRTLWIELYIAVNGEGGSDPIDRSIDYQTPIKMTVRDQGISGVKIPHVDIPNLITISGSVDAPLTGTWNRENKQVSVLVINRDISTEIGTNEPMPAGWLAAETYVNDGQWKISAPSSEEDTEVTFKVRHVAGGPSPYWNYLGFWEGGQKTNLAPTTIRNENVIGIDLGTIPFVVVSGDTPVTVNGDTPYKYLIDFGNYEEGGNGWSGETSWLADATGGAWSVPMPANITLYATIVYYEKSLMQRGSTSGIQFNTGDSPLTIDLSGISYYW